MMEHAMRDDEIERGRPELVDDAPVDSPAEEGAPVAEARPGGPHVGFTLVEADVVNPGRKLRQQGSGPAADVQNTVSRACADVLVGEDRRLPGAQERRDDAVRPGQREEASGVDTPDRTPRGRDGAAHPPGLRPMTLQL